MEVFRADSISRKPCGPATDNGCIERPDIRPYLTHMPPALRSKSCLPTRGASTYASHRIRRPAWTPFSIKWRFLPVYRSFFVRFLCHNVAPLSLEAHGIQTQCCRPPGEVGYMGAIRNMRLIAPVDEHIHFLPGGETRPTAFTEDGFPYDSLPYLSNHQPMVVNHA